MAVREDVVLVADGGEVTAGRQKHTFVYGEFNVRLPEGVEQVETDERLADGFVYRPEGVIAPFDVGFARADVTVDLEVQSTDLELVVDEAQRDAEGEIFFERDITPGGLGEFVPGVDFVVGDVVSVERWRVLLPLPVTGWEMVSSASDGVVADRVHVSGQLVSDAVARGRRNADLRRQVEADKRQLQRSVQSVRSAVAVERAERQEDVNQVRVVLGGARASEESLVSQLAAVQAQITGMVGDGETPPPAGLLNSYLWMNTKLWEQQQTINDQNAKFRDMQEEITARQVQTNLLHNYLIEYNRIMAEAYRPTFFWLRTDLGANPAPDAQTKAYGFNVMWNDSDEPLRELRFTEVVSYPYTMNGSGNLPGVAASGIVEFAFHAGRGGYMRTYLCRIGLNEKGFSVYQSRELRQEVEQRNLNYMDISGDLLPTALLPFYQRQLDALAVEYRAKGLNV